MNDGANPMRDDNIHHGPWNHNRVYDPTGNDPEPIWHDEDGPIVPYSRSDKIFFLLAGVILLVSSFFIAAFVLL